MTSVLSAQAPTAFQDATRSLSPAPDANGKGRRHSAFSRGHHVHVVSNHNQKRVSPCLFAADASSLLNWRGLRSASFSRLHSHRQGASLPLCRLVARGAFASDPAITNSANLAGANRLCVRNTSAHHQSVNAFGDVPHLSSLSSSAVSVGNDPNEIGLTHAQASFAPGAKAND